MYIRLGFQNARANLGRTLMAFCVIAAAALILTVSLSTASGFLAGEHLLLRYYLGADIVMLPGKFVFGQGEFQQGLASWTWSEYDEPWRNDLTGFLLRLSKDGYLTTDGATRLIDVAQVEAALGDVKDVSAVYTYYSLPAITAMPTPQGLMGMMTPLRGRDIALDSSWDPSQFITQPTANRPGSIDGGEPAPGDGEKPGWMVQAEAVTRQLSEFAASDGEMVAMVNLGALPPEIMPPQPGSYLTVQIPMAMPGTNGEPAYDFSKLQPFRLKIVGQFMVPVAEYQMDLDDEGNAVYSPWYWNTSALQIPLKTWHKIAQTVGAPTDLKQVPQLGIVMNSTLSATQLASKLRTQFPEYTVLTAPEIASLIKRAGSQAGLPINVDKPFHFMTILVTSLIVATNAFLLVMQRRREIAIMKSLGASHLNIITLILSELVALAAMASLAGFALFRLVIFNPVLARTNVPVAVIAQQTLSVGLQVVTALTCSALLFGLIPAGKAARTSVMEVLRDA